MHPLVIGELSMGNFADRKQSLDDLRRIGAIASVSDDEVLGMVEAHRLFGTGLGWADAHLLAAARLAGAAVWSRDEALRKAAARLGIKHSE